MNDRITIRTRPRETGFTLPVAKADRPRLQFRLGDLLWLMYVVAAMFAATRFATDHVISLFQASVIGVQPARMLAPATLVLCSMPALWLMGLAHLLLRGYNRPRAALGFLAIACYVMGISAVWSMLDAFNVTGGRLRSDDMCRCINDSLASYVLLPALVALPTLLMLARRWRDLGWIGILFSLSGIAAVADAMLMGWTIVETFGRWPNWPV